MTETQHKRLTEAWTEASLTGGGEDAEDDDAEDDDAEDDDEDGAWLEPDCDMVASDSTADD